MFRQLIAALVATLALNAFAAVEVNQASRADLETVKGIGPGLSGKILEARRSGEFRNWDDLVDRVSGIGAGNAAKLSQAGLTVTGASYAAGPTPQTADASKAPRAAKAPKAPKKAATADPAKP